LSFGTKVIIPTGYGYLDRSKPTSRIFEIDDVGNGKEYYKKKDGALHIDLRYINHDDAIKFAGPNGYKFMKVFIIEE